MEIADRAYVLENGHIALEGPCRDLMDNSYVKRRTSAFSAPGTEYTNPNAKHFLCVCIRVLSKSRARDALRLLFNDQPDPGSTDL